MIRLIQRRLIIPRGDTGTFSIPMLPGKNAGDVSIFTVFDPLSHRKLLEKSMTLEDEVLSIQFSHNDTVNLPVGQFVWDIKFYSNPVFADGKLVDGEEVDSYYAAFTLPVCEIRQTGDMMLMVNDAALPPDQLDILLATLNATIAAKNEAVTSAAEADTSATNAETSASAALASEQAAQNSEVAAAASQTGAAASASHAASSASAAQEAAAQAAQIAAQIHEEIPTKVSELENDSGYLSEETDPTVPNWAKQAQKPTYTAQEVGALPADTVIPTVPTNVSAFTNDAGYLTQHQDISGKADKADTVLDTTLSRGRKENTTVGGASLAFGVNAEASGYYSVALGLNTTASSQGAYAEGKGTVAHYIAHAEGEDSQALSSWSHAQNLGTIANGGASSASGRYTIANGADSFVIGKYNAADSYDNWPTWTANTSYEVGDRVKRNLMVQNEPTDVGYHCTVANTDATFDNAHWKLDGYHMNYVEIVGNGDQYEDPETHQDVRAGSNAYALEWNGTGHFAGDVYVRANADSSGGIKLATMNDLPTSVNIWSGLTYHTSTMSTDSDSFVLGGATDAPTEINKCLVTSTPGANVIPKFDYQGRLYSVTPEDEWDGSNAVATTEYVDNMISDNMPEVPTNVSELTNDAGYLTSYTETDPTVPAWAKAQTKPTYTASEVGAPTVQEMNTAIGNAIGNINSFDMAVVQALPTGDISTHTIYLVPKTGETNDVYDEYVYINNAWEMVGNTQIDLSNYATKSEIPEVPVQDVQINGTSILDAQGMANIPIAQNDGTPGLVKIISSTAMGIQNIAGYIAIKPAIAEDIKSGEVGYKPITTTFQHNSTFYGLAKAAGDTTQSQSDNAVGTYTDEAKAAIQSMLGVAAASDLSAYATKSNTILDNTLSRGRKEGTVVGTASLAFGQNSEASGTYSVAIGNGTTALEIGSYAQGFNTIASGKYSRAEGYATEARAIYSHAQGYNTIAAGGEQFVFGKYNVADDLHEWVANTEYKIGDRVKITTISEGITTIKLYICKEDNEDETFTSSKWQRTNDMNYIEIVGNGTANNARSNAYALDWDGNGHYMGNVYVGCNADSTGGTMLPKDVQINGASIISNGVANIPYASDQNSGGIVRANDSYGIAYAGQGLLAVNCADANMIKAGSNAFHPIVPYFQHESIFYGLAKAAGDTSQASSSNTVGTYTDTAAAAIRTMIGASSPNVVAVQDTQPTDADNKVWLPETAPAGIEVPTYAEFTAGLAGKVSDVQVNGTSIVNNGIANIPVASSQLGLVKINPNYGIGILNDQLMINSATSAEIKAANNSTKSIAANRQHESVFYGLSKAAGINLANEEVTVGTYPETSKAAIQHMLGTDINLAPYESDTTSDAAYAIGEMFMLNGKLHQATAAIAIGDTLEVGTNCSVMNVASVFPHDVQVNGVSVVNNGVANVPLAGVNTYGTVKVGANGITLNSSGVLSPQIAIASDVKTGTTTTKLQVPANQHIAAFYGLATAAGDTTQSSSSNPVGTYTEDAKAAIQQMLDVPSTDDIPNIPVQDVQVNGTSILQDGVANVPIATASQLGVVFINPSLGLYVANTGSLTVNPAGSSYIKSGTNGYYPLVTARQHESVFYGLAKAAGDTTQSASSNAVGTYTTEAKAAIQSMLGIDLQSIASEVEIPLVETVSGTTPTITGQPNTRYVCDEVTTISITPPSAGSVDVIFESGSTAAVLTVPNTVRWPAWFDATSLETDTTYEILITDGVYGSVMTWAN